ncbi:MAG: alkylation response protein AidB-like acyl-CoA dehydrogenase [Alteromonadaceae bacterium]|jgi:alkylation response protein AidB-like acyl-CoA dehydrogenase
MSEYRAPLKDMQFLLHEVFQVEALWSQLPELAELIDKDTANAILAEGAKLTAEVIAPLNRNSDEQGAVWHDGEVTTPDGFKKAYQLYCDGGWGALSGDADFGGMGMPKMLQGAFEEMTQSASISFALYPMLTAGACLALAAHASTAMKSTYLEKMYSGIWSGTMCLTEPHSGSDLGIMTSKAQDNGDDSFSISGTKIFITGGEHDLTENIIHLVLAKIPGAPAGPRGISMFVVPKFLVNSDGRLGARNTLACGSIEHKMGIKGSATSVMNFDGAKGYLVGEQNKGLNYMFTMMNYERLGMGIQGIGAAEVSYQQAAAYAHDRIQGRSAIASQRTDKVADPLIVHADVRRMLLTMRSLNEAGRCFSTYVAKQLDIVKFSESVEDKNKAEQLVALLTPVAKAFLTDMSYDNCGLGQMVFGGHGYIREWGQEQLVRDVRIAQIYEGTNGIQAFDLLGRKVVASKGQLFSTYQNEISQFIKTHQDNEALTDFIKPLQQSLVKLDELTQLLLTNSQQDKNLVGASATDYLAVFGYVSYSYMWAMMAEKSITKIKQDDFYQAKLYVGKFYMQRLLPRVDSHIQAILAGSEPLMAMPAALFGYEE